MAIELSIVIATYNSEQLLPLVLNSIKKQTYPKSRLEVLLVDGGSIDETIKIGRKFGCRVVKNPRTEPVHAKFLGYKRAGGKYLMYLDHDEVLVNKKSLEVRINALKSHPSVKAIAGGNYVSPKGYHFINDYINDFGDPFSFFLYRLSKRNGFFINSMRRRYRVLVENTRFAIFDLSKVFDLPLLEQVAGGAVIDGATLKKGFPETLERAELVPHFYYLLHSRYPYVLITKNDLIIHYSSDTLQKYQKKLIWRVKNNIFFVSSMGMAGLTGREKYMSGLQRLKKYLYLPYAFSLILPLLDSVYLVFTRKNIKYFVHFYLVLFMGAIVVYYYLMKLMGISPQLRSYDESKIINDKLE